MLSESYARNGAVQIGIHYAIELANAATLILVATRSNPRGGKQFNQYNSLIKFQRLLTLGSMIRQNLHKWCKQNSFNVEVLVNNAAYIKTSDFIETSGLNIFNPHHNSVMLCYYLENCNADVVLF